MLCDTNNPNDLVIASKRNCHVNHSYNTVPHFNCSRQLSVDMVLNTSAVRQTGYMCPVKYTTYNITTFTVDENDLREPTECDVSYCSPTDLSHVYLTEHFVIPPRVQDSDVPDATASNPTAGKNVFC